MRLSSRRSMGSVRIAMAGIQDSGGTVRHLQEADLSAVAHLFQRTFRRTADSAPGLVPHLRDCFLNHVWQHDEIVSQVFVTGDQQVRGFIGVVPARLRLADRPVTAAFAGSMMVEDPSRYPLAGARLLRAFLSGPQDISITETANRTALGMWQKLGTQLEPAYSLNWLKVLRPAGASVSILERRLRAARLLAPVARLADQLGQRLRFYPAAPVQIDRPRRLTFRTVSPQEFAEASLDLANAYLLRPDWDASSLSWFLHQARQKRSLGEPFYRVADGAHGKPLAAYAYFGRPGGIGWLLQSFASGAQAEDLVDDMFVHAHEHGFAGVRGAAQPWLNAALMTRNTLFYGRSFFVAKARDESLLESVRAGRALISGLAGESWTRLIGDTFD